MMFDAKRTRNSSARSLTPRGDGFLTIPRRRALFQVIAMVQKRQTEEDRIQLVNDMLVEKILGWRVSATRYYKAPCKFVSKRSFDPMRNLSAAMSLIQHARLRNPDLVGELVFKLDDAGSMMFNAYVRLCAGQSGCAARRPWASMALAEALASAYRIDLQGGAR